MNIDDSLEKQEFSISFSSCAYAMHKFKMRLIALGLHSGAKVYVEKDNGDKLILRCSSFKVGVDKIAMLPFLKEVE